MAGHSKWANIKYRKGKADRLKSKLFSRIAKEIITAVKLGGQDPKSNIRLRLALQKAKSANMPNDTIERNIKKGSSADADEYTETVYEIYGCEGVGILVEAISSNKNRTTSDIRGILNKKGGVLGSVGSVSYHFETKGIIQVPHDQISEEELFTAIADLGIDEFEKEGETFILIMLPELFGKIKETLDTLGIESQSAQIDRLPLHLIKCTPEGIKDNLLLINSLEELDDVDSVYHNMELD